MTQALGVAPTTFVPPWNSGDANTLKACSALGFTLYSTSTSDFNVGQAYLDGITVQGESGGLVGWNSDAAWQTGMQALTKGTDAALNNMTAGQSFVLGHHFWSFENPDGSVNPAWVALFKQYIDHLKSRGDVLFTTVGGQQLLNPSPAPAVCSDGNSLDVFAQGAYHALWYKHWNDTMGWSNWEYLGGYLASSPAATSLGNGMIDVCVRGGNGAVYEKTTTDGGTSWSNWISLGGQIPAGTGPAACSWGAGRLDVVARGTDGRLWHRWDIGGTWSGWQSIGGSPTSSPAATSPANGVIDVFARGSDDGLWETTYNSGWSGWTSAGAMWS